MGVFEYAYKKLSKLPYFNGFTIETDKTKNKFCITVYLMYQTGVEGEFKPSIKEAVDNVYDAVCVRVR